MQNVKFSVTRQYNTGTSNYTDINLNNVLFAFVNRSTGISTLTLADAPGGTPTTVTINADFRDVVAGAGRSGENSGPIFGVFTDTSSKNYVVLNFDQLLEYVNSSTITFNNYGTVAGFTYTLLEDPIDVLGNAGHSIEDVGLYIVYDSSSHARIIINMRAVVDQGVASRTIKYSDGSTRTVVENILDLVGG